MLTVNSELNKLGLILNAAKSHLIDIKDLSEYYLYDALSLLDENKFDESFSLFNNLYENKSSSIRYDTYLKHIISRNIGLKKFNLRNRSKAKELLLGKNFLIVCNDTQLNRIYENLEDAEHEDFIKQLWEYSNSISFNSYFFYVYKFFVKNKLNIEAEKMRNYIETHFSKDTTAV